MTAVSLRAVDPSPWKYVRASAVGFAVLTVLAFGTSHGHSHPHRTAEPIPVVATGPATYHHDTAPTVTITRADTRRRIEQNGQTWADFIAQTTDRQTYDVGFVAAWLR